jgi:hypothetical protein
VDEIQCDPNDAMAKRRARRTHTDVVFDNVYDWRAAPRPSRSAAATAVAKGFATTSHQRGGVPSGGEYAEDNELMPSDYPNTYGAKADTERALCPRP